jgi:hypothetical protein
MRRKKRLGTIPKPVLQPNAKTVQFSFKHLDTTHPKFLLEDCTCEYWAALVRRLVGYSQLTVEIFLDQNNPDRRHIIDFSGTSEQGGFSNVDTEQLAYQEAWQFDLDSRNPDWRVCGLLLDDMFYIIWLDHSHRLYPH